MEPISGCTRRRSDQLGSGGPEGDRISALDDDLLLLVLTRLGCVGAAARTGVLARRWRGLWAILRHIIFRDVHFSSLEAALVRISRPPPGLTLLDICVPGKKPRPDATGVTSLLRAAALLEPKELVLSLPTRMVTNSPMFFLQLPADVKFPALEALSLSGCHVRFDSLLPRCPRLRALRVQFSDHGDHEDIKTFMSIHSASLEEFSVEVATICVDVVDLVVPELKQLTISLTAYSETSSIVHAGVEVSTKEIDKHLLIARFAVLDLHLKTKGHVFGAFVFHLLGMNQCFRRMRMLNLFLQRSSFKQECPLDCACAHLDWRSQTTISLDSLQEVKINGFEGYDHEIDFLKLLFKCAPMLKRMTVVLSHEVSSPDATCIQINNIFGAYLSVECYLYIAQG